VIFAFEDCELDTRRYQLRQAGAVVHVEPQVFGVLAYSLEHHDRVVDDRAARQGARQAVRERVDTHVADQDRPPRGV
jgi:DNA-binding response OmpR family regulator